VPGLKVGSKLSQVEAATCVHGNSRLDGFDDRHLSRFFCLIVVRNPSSIWFMRRAGFASLVAFCLVLRESFGSADIECKVKTNTMITEPGHFHRAVVLVNQGKANEARRLVRCLRSQGTRMFITGKPTRGHEMFVPVTTGDCSGETYRPYLLCPGDKAK
jgi:hypothetical protein